MNDSLGRIVGRIFSKVIPFALAVVLLVSGCAIVSSFADLTAERQEVLQTLEDIRDRASAAGGGGPAGDAVKALVAQLEFLTQRGLDSNAIEFIFGTFSMGLIAIAAYLVDKSRQDVESVAHDVGGLRSQVLSYSQLTLSQTAATQVMMNAFQVYILGTQLCESVVRKPPDCAQPATISDHGDVALTRDALNSLSECLRSAIDANAGFDPISFDLVRDLLMGTASRLQELSKSYANEGVDLHGRCEDCIRLLDWTTNAKHNRRGHDFVRRYKELLAAAGVADSQAPAAGRR